MVYNEANTASPSITMEHSLQGAMMILMKTTEGPYVDPALQGLLDIEKISDEMEERRIKPEKFKGHPHFDSDEIDRDLRRCEELKQLFRQANEKEGPHKKEQSERGLTAEFVFRRALEEYGWLSDKLKMILTSTFDDFENGIDSVAQIELGPSRYEHIGFAVDFAASRSDVGQKLSRCFDEIDSGRSARVKYFDSEKTGQLRNFKVPRIVVGAGQENLDRLVSYSAEMINDSGEAGSIKEKIKADPYRFVLFGIIEAQLSVFIGRLSKVIDKMRQAKHLPVAIAGAQRTLDMYRQTLATILQLAEEAGIDSGTIQKHIRGDKFAMEIARDLSILSRTPIDLNADSEGPSPMYN